MKDHKRMDIERKLLTVNCWTIVPVAVSTLLPPPWNLWLFYPALIVIILCLVGAVVVNTSMSDDGYGF